MFPTIITILALISPLVSLKSAGVVPVVMATHSMSLNTRYGNSYVNDVFKDNILLTLSYLDGRVTEADQISWETVEKPFHFEMTLKPGEVFAFHDQVLPEYQGKVTLTTHAHFNYQDGFKSDGFLTGDGVCHLASLIYWVAKDAGLTAVAPTNHNFANIPEVPKEYGVSIYAMPGNPGTSARENLYITNNQGKDVKFVFDYQDNILSVSLH